MADGRPQGVALYVHWPYCARICPYCDFNVVRERGQTEQPALADAMLTDLERQAAMVAGRPLASIFFGGGTPSLMRPEWVGRIVEAAHRLLPTTAPVEITLEANPTDAEADRFAGFAAAGVQRLSIGVQAFDDADLRFLGRNHDAAEAMRAVDLAGRLFPRLSIDLIYALPGQTVAAWIEALERAMTLGFEHVSPYQLTVEAATAFGRAARRGDWTPPDGDTAADLYEATQGVLEAAGFEAYEVSNHAQGAAARSAHNLHVWRGGDYIGVGPGAHGRLTLGGARTATVAHRRIADYLAGVAAGTPWAEVDALSPADAAEERLLLGLRTLEGVPEALVGQVGAVAAAEDLVADGYLARTAGRIAATARGRPVLDAVLKALLT
ncbi:coproporphyrinogen III oxidase [Brevundimonas sp. Leaf363]|uniref:radical SAM family heme chaperone HemW n=1 Tax=Brevundimonas sp. Leaf363 TaxID=1736353 RepID=UPI000701921F|nr:radical SAM family heme chaperone HemW [Brevundimonas sp. Leaf363]KQS57329.1 coproporphyrinogen III oxidase [Brevundimonas sp. Leaf363]